MRVPCLTSVQGTTYEGHKVVTKLVIAVVEMKPRRNTVHGARKNCGKIFQAIHGQEGELVIGAAE